MSRVGWLDTARIVAAFAVVVVHAAAPVAGDPAPERAGWWAAHVYDSVARWCVPVFVMASGALLLSRGEDESALGYAAGRLPRILVPLVAWAAIYLLWRYARETAQDGDPAYVDYLRDAAAGEPWYHLWYLYMILPLYLIAPFLKTVVDRFSRRDVLLLVFLCFAGAMLEAVANSLFGREGPPLFFTWFLSYLGYFLAGYAIYRESRHVGWLVPAGVFLVSAVATVLASAAAFRAQGGDLGFYFYSYLSVTVVPMSLAAFLLFRAAPQPGALARLAGRAAPYALGVYLVHPIVLHYTRRGLDALGDPTPALGVPLLAVAAFALSLLVTALLARVPLARRIV